MLQHGWKGMFCHAVACTTLPAEQRELMEHSRDARHHECPLWASLWYNTGLLISHWITFTPSTNLFCNAIHGSKVMQRSTAKGFFTYRTATYDYDGCRTSKGSYMVFNGYILFSILRFMFFLGLNTIY